MGAFRELKQPLCSICLRTPTLSPSSPYMLPLPISGLPFSDQMALNVFLSTPPAQTDSALCCVQPPPLPICNCLSSLAPTCWSSGEVRGSEYVQGSKVRPMSPLRFISFSFTTVRHLRRFILMEELLGTLERRTWVFLTCCFF